MAEEKKPRTEDRRVKRTKKMLRESLKNTEENFAEENIDFDSKRLMSAIEALADSSITPLDLTRAAGSLSMTANASKMIYEKDQRTDAESYESVAELHKYAQAATVGLWILLGGAALTFLLAVFAALTGKKLGALPKGENEWMRFVA